MKIKDKMLWIIVVLAIGIALFPFLRSRTVSGASSLSAQGMAPDFSLSDKDGKTIHLSDFKGKVVLVNFFASWCPPCRMEIPGFERMYTEYKQKGFEVVGIAVDEVSSSFIKDMGMTYPVVDASDSVIDAYGNVSSIPVSFLVGKDGKILKKVMGVYFEDSMKADLEKALKS